MNLLISSSDALETIIQNPSCPTFLQNILEKTTTFQERDETTLLASLRAKTNFSEWVAALLIFETKAILKNGEILSLQDLLCKNSILLKDLSKLEISSVATDFYGFEKIANTPADRSIISIFIHLKFHDNTILQATIIATGVSKSAFEIANCSEFLVNKKINEEIIRELKKKLIDEFNPPDSYLATSQYKKEMVAILVEKILLKKIMEKING